MFRQAFHELIIATRGRGLVEFTREVEAVDWRKTNSRTAC